MLFGSFSGGSFTSGDTDSSDRCKLFAYDGCAPKGSSWRSFSIRTHQVDRKIDDLRSFGFLLFLVTAVAAQSDVADG